LSVTYVYCLVRGSRKPALRRVAGGLPGAGPARALDAGNGLWLIAADVDDAEYSEKAIAAGLQDLEWVSARAVGHEAIIEQFLSAPAVLPMQLFTIFKSDARALEYVTKNRRRIDRILERIDGHVEWGVRLTWDEQAARAAVEDAHRPGGASGGAAYLARKKDLRDVNRAQLADARAEATRVFKDLSRHATDAVRRTSTEQAAPGSRLLLDAAYLVPARRGAAFKTAVRQRVRGLQAAGLAVSVTGPWPAYNFIA
jgi:Gas vesicle synthesis protein GvpL/GvpF